MFLVAWHFFLYMLAEFVEFLLRCRMARYEEVEENTRRTDPGAVVSASVSQPCINRVLRTHDNGKKQDPSFMVYRVYPDSLFRFKYICRLSMVIFEGSISHKVFGSQLDEAHHKHYDDILVGLSKICSVAMFGYFFLKIILVVHEHAVQYLNSPMGFWYLLEIIGFVLVPCFMFAHGAQQKNTSTIKFAAIITMIGIIINRLNYTFIAYNWYVPLSEKYWPARWNI